MIQATSASAITVGGRESESLRAAADRILDRPPPTGTLVPLPFASTGHSVEEDLIRWELIRAGRLGGGTEGTLDSVSLSLSDNPELVKKIKQQYAELHKDDKEKDKKDKKVADPNKLTLRELKEVFDKGLAMNRGEASDLLSALRLMNEESLAKKAGKPVDRPKLLADLVKREAQGLAFRADNKPIANLPAATNDKLVDEYNRVFKDTLPQPVKRGEKLTPKQIEELIKDPKFKPGTLSEKEWKNLLGEARIQNAKRRGMEFATEIRRDSRRDDAVLFNRGYHLPGEEPPPIANTTPRNGNGNGDRDGGRKPPEQGGGHRVGNGGRPDPTDRGGNPDEAGPPPSLPDRFDPPQSAGGQPSPVEIPGGVSFDPRPRSDVPPSAGRSVPIVPSNGLTDPNQARGLLTQARPNGYDLEMEMTYKDASGNSLPGAAVCHGSLNGARQKGNECLYAFSSAAHCVRKEEELNLPPEQRSRLESMQIEGFGYIPKFEPGTMVDPRPGADYAILFFKRPGACRTDLPIVPLADDQLTGETPVMLETQQGTLLGTATPADNFMVQLNLRNGFNGGRTINPGDSGGPIMIQGPDGKPRLVAVISSKLRDERNFFQIGYGASAASLGLAKNQYRLVMGDGDREHGTPPQRPTETPTHVVSAR